MGAESAQKLLTAAYITEVRYRGREYREDKDTAEHIAALAQTLTAERPKIGFALCGQCGNGKTTLLYALNSAIELMRNTSLKHLLSQRESLWVVDALRLASAARDDAERFRQMCDTPLLAIEDMGKEAAEVVSYGNTLNPIAEVIERRYDKQLFTAITTNLTPKMMSEKYGERVADRFREMLDVITFKNGSYR